MRYVVENHCVFYKETHDGRRCVLLSPEEWRVVAQRYLQHCRAGGKGCVLLSRILLLLENSSLLRDQEKSPLLH